MKEDNKLTRAASAAETKKLESQPFVSRQHEERRREIKCNQGHYSGITKTTYETMKTLNSRGTYAQIFSGPLGKKRGGKVTVIKKWKKGLKWYVSCNKSIQIFCPPIVVVCT